jgi:uncharacterized protein (TIGR02246 family)
MLYFSLLANRPWSERPRLQQRRARNQVKRRLSSTGTSEIQEIKVLGDWAFMWTKLTVVVTPPGGAQPMTRAGHTLSILKKQNGKWVLARDANMLVSSSGK